MNVQIPYVRGAQNICNKYCRVFYCSSTGLGRLRGLQEVEAPGFSDTRHMKVTRLSALHTGHLYLPGQVSVTHFCYRLSRTQDHSAAGRIKSI